jgi:hypothetical protein
MVATSLDVNKQCPTLLVLYIQQSAAFCLRGSNLIREKTEEKEKKENNISSYLIYIF